MGSFSVLKLPIGLFFHCEAVFGDILDPVSVFEVAWRSLWVREYCWPITLHSQIGDTSIESRVDVPEESVDIGVQFFVHDSPLQFSVWPCREAIERDMHK